MYLDIHARVSFVRELTMSGFNKVHEQTSNSCKEKLTLFASGLICLSILHRSTGYYTTSSYLSAELSGKGFEARSRYRPSGTKRHLRDSVRVDRGSARRGLREGRLAGQQKGRGGRWEHERVCFACQLACLLLAVASSAEFIRRSPR